MEKLEISKTEAKALLSLAKKLGVVESSIPVLNEVEVAEEVQPTVELIQDEIGNFVPVQPSVETVEPSVQTTKAAAKAGDMVTAAAKLQEAMELTPSHWTSVQMSVIAKAKELGFTTSA